MKHIAWFFRWALKAAIFFTLFAFALNNQHDVTVRFFFGQQWTAPLVLVVLIVFGLGLFFGILGMIPRWWQQRKASKQAPSPSGQTPLSTPSVAEHSSYGI